MEMSALLPSSPAPLAESPSRHGVRWALSRIRAYSRASYAPPASDSRVEQVLYGFAQPLLGIRVLLSDFSLLVEALAPAMVLAGACALWASIDAVPGPWGWLKAFYRAFAALAVLPSLVFANHYARLAALVRWRLGFGSCGPREMPMTMLVGRMMRQAALVVVGVIPFTIVWTIIPGVGDVASQAVLGLWAIHWVVADAFDDAQILTPGETLRQSIAHDRAAPPPWFVRVLHKVADKIPFGPVSGPLRRFARFCNWLARDSRGEIATMERNPVIVFGFALSTATLLAIPVLNLLFRPVIIVASSHLLGHLERDEHASGAGIPTSALAR